MSDSIPTKENTMFKQRKRGDDDDDDDRQRIVRDGETVRTPMFLMDATQRAIATHLHDGHGNRDVVGHRPGFIVDANANDARQTAYDEYRRDVENAWRVGPAREYPASAEGTTCTVRGYKYRDHFGARGTVVDGECVPDELQRDALPTRDGKNMTLLDVQARHAQVMRDVYGKYDAAVREMWRNP